MNIAWSNNLEKFIMIGNTVENFVNPVSIVCFLFFVDGKCWIWGFLTVTEETWSVAETSLRTFLGLPMLQRTKILTTAL